MSFYIRTTLLDIRDNISSKVYDSNKYYTKDRIYLSEDNTNIDLENFIGVNRDRSKSSLPGCSDGVINGEISYCELGDLESDKTILLVGGSRLAQWEPIFTYLGNNEGYKIIAATIHSCSVGFDLGPKDEECQKWNESLMSFIDDLDPKPRVLVMNSSRSEHLKTIQAYGEKYGIERGEYIPKEYIQAMKQISSLGIPIIGLRINPVAEDPVACVWNNRADTSKCRVKIESSLLETNPALGLKEEGVDNLYPVDFTEVMCSEGFCPLSFDGYLTMIDDSHYSGSYINYLAPTLNDALDEQVGGISKFFEN